MEVLVILPIRWQTQEVGMSQAVLGYIRQNNKLTATAVVYTRLTQDQTSQHPNTEWEATRKPRAWLRNYFGT